MKNKNILLNLNLTLRNIRISIINIIFFHKSDIFKWTNSINTQETAKTWLIMKEIKGKYLYKETLQFLYYKI